MADFVAEVCVRLQEANIPHNLFIVDCGMRVFLYPNAFAAAKAEVSRISALLCLVLDGTWFFACNCHQLKAFTQICLGALRFMQDNAMDMCLSAVRSAEWSSGQLSSNLL